MPAQTQAPLIAARQLRIFAPFLPSPLNCRRLDVMIYWSRNWRVVLLSVRAGQVTADGKLYFPPLPDFRSVWGSE